VASFAGAIAVAAALGIALARLLGLRASGALFEPHPGPRIAAAWLVGIAAAVGVAGLVRRRASFDAVFAGHALAWNALALALARIVPGASYLFIVPGLVVAALAATRTRWPVGELAASLGALVAAAVVCLPFALFGYEALGDTGVPVAAVLLALVGTSFAPLVSSTAPRLAPGCLVLAIALGGVAAIVPRTSPDHPHHQPIAYVADADAGSARWQVDAALPGLRAAAAFDRRPVAPWLGPAGVADIAPAPVEPLAPPTATATVAPGPVPDGAGTRVVTLDLASPRHALRLGLAWHSDAETVALRINGVTPPPRTTLRGRRLAPGWNRIVVFGASAGAHIEITQRGAAPTEAIVSDASIGLPASAAALVRARDAAGAVPVHDGDTTIVQRHLTW
jgi:hypothetical protein